MKKALLPVFLALLLITGCTRGFKAWTSVESDLGFATFNISSNWKKAEMSYVVNIFPNKIAAPGDIEGEIRKAIKKDDSVPKLIFHFFDNNKNEILKAEAPLKDMEENLTKQNKIYFTYKDTVPCSKADYNKISALDIKWDY